MRQRIQILLLYGYSYLVTVSERCVGERVVRVSLNLDDAIVEDWLVPDVEDVGHRSDVSPANPKDCKNATFDVLSFFFLVQSDDWILANVDVVVADFAFSLVSFDPFNTSISCIAC